MTEQEKINSEVQMKLALQDAKISVFVQEMKDFKDEMKDFKQEMRDRDNQRHGEISEIRQALQGIQDSSRNQTIAMAIGIAAMVIAVLLK